MAITVVNQWTATENNVDHEIPITPADGNWVAVIASWRTVDGSSPTLSVGDLRRNLWHLAKTVDHPTAGLHMQIWVCPHILTYGGETSVYVAASFISASDVGSVAVDVVELSGLSDYLQFDVMPVGTASATTTLSITTATPGAACLMLAAVAIDNSARTITVTSGGWTNLTTVTAASGPSLRHAAMWQAAASVAKTGAWSLSGAANLVGLVVAIREVGAAPAITPDWGGAVALEVQLALGYDQLTPVNAMRWLTLSTRCQSLRAKRGLDAENQSVNAGDISATWTNDNGSLTPRVAGSAVVILTGTTGTAKISDVEAPGFAVGDFVRLQSSDGALKEDTVFQISAMPSSAGVTTVSFTPAAAVSTAVGDVLTGVPIDIYTPVRALATVDGKCYPVAVGSSEAIPQAWLDGTHGRVNMTGVDAYATLTATIPNVLDGQILAADPYAFWPLTDPQGAGRAANASPRSSAPLVQRTSKYGAGSAEANFGAATQRVPIGSVSSTDLDDLIGAGGSTGWSQLGLVTGDTTKGFALIAEDDNFPAISGGVTIVGISLLYVAQPSVDPTVVILRNGDPGAGVSAGSIIKLALDPSADVAITVWDKDTHASTRTLGTGVIIGNSAFTPWALTFTRTAWTAYVDGSFFSFSGSCDLVDRFTSISFGGEADAFWAGHCGNGVHSRFAIYDRVLTPGELDAWYSAARLGMSLETSSDGTIRRQLSRAEWPGARILGRSDITTSEDVGLEGGAVGEVVAGISRWEDGLLWVDAAGYLQFRSRDQLDRATSKFTLGPDTGAGEIPYLGAPTYDADGKLLFTEVDVVNVAKFAPGPTAAVDRTGTFPAIQPPPRRYGIRPLPWPAHLAEAEDIYGVGQWVLSRYGTPRLRVKQVQIDPRAASGTTGWHAILGAEVGDVITVEWAPGSAPAITTRCVILGIAHDTTPSRWTATLTLMVAPEPGIVLDDPVTGVITAGTLTL